MILDDILAHKREEVAARRRARPLAALRDEPLYPAARRGFRAALAGHAAPAIIAELKQASPSRGRIRADYDPAAIASGYAAGGATALSVLTDERYFAGTLDHLAVARRASGLPCLRKDFLVDPYQVEEARAWGADAVLVIAAAVDDAAGRELLAAAAAAGLDVLVEIHDARELEWAGRAGATLIGINNRDLRTFTISLATTEALAPGVPASALLVAESGIRSAADLRRMTAAGAHAVLIGEAFMERSDPGAALKDWLADVVRCR
jgi:indole-3-glycerol phosphate synthase